MSRNRYYYYDHASCTFVEVKQKGSSIAKHAAVIGAISVLVAGILSFTVDRMMVSPEELALRAENRALQEELQRVGTRIEEYAVKIDELSEHDQTLYRTLLDADPISADVRRVAVGGSDAYEAFDRYNESTANILRTSAQMLDDLERRISLQNTSYRQLMALAAERDQRMEEMPAILPADGPIVSGYGMRFHPILRVRRMHHGLDIVVPIGTPVHATGDGVVREAGRNAGYGKYVEIEHTSTGYTTLYAHLDQIHPHVRRGVRVKRGDEIALSGNTGRSTGPHLHYEVRDSDGRTLNPIYFIAPSMTPQEYQRLLASSELDAASLD
jgi:murein DD-endopeptidase MepM/ murein hydrolase activator NlpD